MKFKGGGLSPYQRARRIYQQRPRLVLALAVLLAYFLIVWVYYGLHPVKHMQAIASPTSSLLIYRYYFPRDFFASSKGREPKTVAVILPVTSKGSEGCSKEDLITVAVFWPSFVASVQDNGRLSYTVYVGIEEGDEPLLHYARTGGLEEDMRAEVGDAKKIEIKLVYYPKRKGLGDMYNTLARQAYEEDNMDYFLLGNDDLVIKPQWGEALVQTLEDNPVRANFGMAGTFEHTEGLARHLTPADRCSTYPLLSRTHFDIFEGNMFDPFFQDYGIDVHLCATYYRFSSLLYVTDVKLRNRVTVSDMRRGPSYYESAEWFGKQGGQRYKPGEGWREHMQERVDRAVLKIVEWRDTNEIVLNV